MECYDVFKKIGMPEGTVFRDRELGSCSEYMIEDDVVRHRFRGDVWSSFSPKGESKIGEILKNGERLAHFFNQDGLVNPKGEAVPYIKLTVGRVRKTGEDSFVKEDGDWTILFCDSQEDTVRKLSELVDILQSK